MKSTNRQAEIFCRYHDGKIHYGKVTGDIIHELDKAPWYGGQATGVTLRPEYVKLLYPSEPNTIIGLGKLYQENWRDKVPPKTVRWFIKPVTAAASDGENVVLPPSLDEVKVECELVIVVGKKIKNADEDEANGAIFGYTIGNDIMGSVDSYHRINGDLPDMEETLLATGLKSCDGFQPFGPYIYRGLDWKDRKISLDISYEDSTEHIHHEQNTNTFIYSPAKMVSDLSRVFTLSPGDILSTGTIRSFPARAGALVTVTIDGFGSLTNRITK